jgi:transcription antitermination factor NusG
MYMSADNPWYLVRTKANKERFVRGQLAHIVPDIFMPMLKLPFSRLRSATPSLVPLFPQYIFVRLHLGTQFFQVRYLPGVTGFVSTGCEPLAVSEAIVDSVRSRCTDSILKLAPLPFRHGEHVRVIEGPFSDFDAIFDTYLSGTKRVAILLKSIEGCGVRVVANASAVVRLSPESPSPVAPSNRS